MNEITSKDANPLIELVNFGKLKEAETLAVQLLDQYPNSLILNNMLGLISLRQNNLEKSIIFFRKAVNINPESAMAHNNLGTSLLGLEKTDEAINILNKAIKIKNDYPDAYNNLGIAYATINQPENAIKNYQQAIKNKPEFGEAHHNLGNVFMSLGKKEEALDSYRNTLKINPQNASTHRSISVLTKYVKNHPHIKEMKQAVLKKNVTNNQLMHLSFALGKAFEDLKEYKKAFNYWKDANRLRRQQINYEIEWDVILFDEIKKKFSNDLFEKQQKIQIKSPSPIFIVGMPRSGTTLVEQILSTHKNVFGAGELGYLDNLVKDCFGFKNNTVNTFKDENFDQSIFKKIGKKYLQNLININRNTKFVSDKMPHNFKWIGIIKLAMPNSKIIHCTREPKDNCFSIFKNFFIGDTSNFSYNLNELGKYYNLYHDLMQHWKKILPDFIYDISYEALIQNQKEETVKLLKACKLDWDKNCLEFYKNKRAIKTASVVQVRKPIYKNSMNSWKNYKDNLKPLFNSLKLDQNLNKDK